MANAAPDSRSDDAMRFSIVTGRTIARLLEEDYSGCVGVIRDAYLAHAQGDCSKPQSSFLRYASPANARIISLPAYLGGRWNLSGIKWIASFPDNVRAGIPRASAALILNDQATGYPFACMEASIVSAARTAASAVLAAENLVRDGRLARCVTFVGTGLISRYIYRFLVETGWELNEVCLYDINPGEAARFAARVCDRQRHRSIEVSADLPAAMKRCDLAVIATIAGIPHIHDPEVLRHNPVVLHISLRDLAPELVLNACNIVDDVEHVLQAETSLHLAEKRVRSRSFIAGTLGGVLEGTCAVDHRRPVIFSPFGLGILDIALAKWFFDRAVERKEAIGIPDFFFDLER